MSDTMWALVKDKPEVGLTFKKVAVPSVGPNDVKIRIHKTAICGTDVHIYNYDEWTKRTVTLGTTTGHEYVGEIVAWGANVTGYRAGELVSGEGHIVCGVCRNCRARKGHLCKAAKGVGVNRDGAFAEYLVIPAVNVWRCVPGIDEELYAIFDPFGNATHTALSFNLLGEDVLITGAGPIGIMAAGIARFSGARHVVITDVNDYRLGLARALGAHRTVNVSKENLTSVMQELNIHEGFDVGLEMSGSGVALNQMIASMYNGGQIGLLGLQQKGTAVDWDKVIFGGLRLKGIYGREMYETWYKMTTMLEGGLDLAKIITHRLNIAQYNEGFAAMNSGEAGKVILDWKL
jgi:threonine 3-dehydrogenase